MKKELVFVFLIVVMLFTFSIDVKSDVIQPAPIPECGNQICEAGSGELTGCPADCEQQRCTQKRDDNGQVGSYCYGDPRIVCSQDTDCSDTNGPCVEIGDCLGDACTDTDGTKGYDCTNYGAAFRDFGECRFGLRADCSVCADNQVNKYYGAWGDYACEINNKISNCKDTFARPSVANFYVNSCDGSGGCCNAGQSSCIKGNECGQIALDGLIKSKGSDGVLGTADDWFYSGGELGSCREQCDTIGACRALANGQAQKCVSCNYRADTLWVSKFGSAGLWSTTNVKNGVWIDDPSCVQNAQMTCNIADGNCKDANGNIVRDANGNPINCCARSPDGFTFTCPESMKDASVTLTYSSGAAKPVVSKLTTNDVNAPSQRQCSNFDANGACTDTFAAQGVQGFTLDTDLKIAGYSTSVLAGNCAFNFGCASNQEWDYPAKKCVDKIVSCTTQVLNGNCGILDINSREATDSSGAIVKTNCLAGESCVICKQGYVWNPDLKKCVTPCDGTATSVLAGRQGGCTILALTTSDVANDLITTANQCQNSRNCVACKTGYVWKGIESSIGGCKASCSEEGVSCGGTITCCLKDTQNRNLYCSRGLDGKNTRGYCCREGQYWNEIRGQCIPTFLCLDADCPNILKAPLSYLTQDKLYFLGKLQNINRCVIETKAYRQACVLNNNLGPSPLRVYGTIHVLDVNKNRVS